MTVLNVLILSGHMTIEHDNEHRSFRLHNQWLTTLLEDTGRFKVRVVEDPRGLGAEIIDKYDVVIVVFEGRDGFFERRSGSGQRRMPRCCASCTMTARASSGSTGLPHRRIAGDIRRSTT